MYIHPVILIGAIVFVVVVLTYLVCGNISRGGEIEELEKHVENLRAENIRLEILISLKEVYYELLLPITEYVTSSEGTSLRVRYRLDQFSIEILTRLDCSLANITFTERRGDPRIKVSAGTERAVFFEPSPALEEVKKVIKRYQNACDACHM